MARPIKDNADYFSHDTSMRDDPRLKALRRKFKHEGYSIWNMLLESITDSDNFRFNIDYEIMGGDYDVDPNRLREIVTYCIELGLLQTDAETSIIWSKTLDNRMSALLSKRKRNRNPADGELSTSENPQSKVKESKVKQEIYGEGPKTITVKPKYLNDRTIIIHDLGFYFAEKCQLVQFSETGWTHFDAFMDENPAKIFDDEDHLYNTFRNFSIRYIPPPKARAPDYILNAEVDMQNLTPEAWLDMYKWQMKNDEAFKKHFNGKLSPSQPVGINDKR